MPPHVSVLIGAYNNASTLPRAMQSILGQTVTNLELIIVDDGSTDDTAEVAHAVNDDRVRYLPLEHMGISRSLNEGLRAARAPVVAVQDADDYSTSERLERQLGLLDARPEVAVVGTRMREEDSEGRTLAPRTSFASGDVTDLLMRFNPIPNSCAAMRRQAVLALGGYDRRWLYAMDYDLWLRVAEHHRLATIDDPLATRVMTGENVAARKERAQIGETISIRMRALRRRRSLRGASGIAVATLAYVTPLPLKRARRRRLGQSP
jgi:glycosyltransferase involved in cell wall biosynthesis